MISRWFPDAILISEFEPDGLSNIVQAASSFDILFIRAKSEQQLNSLIEINLISDFKGLVVSPFEPSRSDINYVVVPLEEMEKTEVRLIDEFYPEPKLPKKIIGITGTNGKTSTCWYCMETGKLMGVRVLYMGTIGVYLNGEKKPDKILTTTPSLLSLRRLQHKYDQEVDVIALEVSSHALAQKRIKGIDFDVVGWTNFTQDHLDFHGDMDSYFGAKLKILSYAKANEIIVSRQEDELIKKIQDHKKVKPTIDLTGLNSDIPLHFSNGFLRSNLEMAITCMSQLKNLTSLGDIGSISSPPGRFEVIQKAPVLFIIDYAHTPDALKKLLEQTRRVYLNPFVWTVFGCGGDRDKRKRPLMLEAALAGSDQVIVTSDNPRTENPTDIMNDIVGVSQRVEKEVDRKRAIELAFSLAKKGDPKKPLIVVIAGKGDEDYQEIDGVRHPFSDVKIVRELV